MTEWPTDTEQSSAMDSSTAPESHGKDGSQRDSRRTQESDPPAGQDAGIAQDCEVHPVFRSQGVVDNLPYIAMISLGASVLWVGLPDGSWRYLAAALYGAYGVTGAVWIIYFVCPYCRFYDTQLCPCGYGRISPRFRARQAVDRFAEQFRRHIPAIVPLWAIPLIAGIVTLVHGVAWGPVILLLAFVLNSFVLLPLVSRKYGCTRCPQKETCPWMGHCKG